jgi:glyoxylase I family protein
MSGVLTVTTSIEHLALAASDPAALARWYCETLGFEPAATFEAERTYFIRLPAGGMLEIIPANTDAPSVSASREEKHGFDHLAFSVDDFESSYRELEMKGIRFTGPVRGLPGGTQLAFFRDPEGNLLQLVYRVKKF